MSHRTLLLVVVFAAIFSFDLARKTDVDFWWHLRAGERIIETGAVPGTDPFSYTAADRPWVAHEWLWEVVVFEIVRNGGYWLAVVLSAGVVTIAYFVLYRLARRLGVNQIAGAALALWAAALALPNIGVRPREWTHLFLACFLHRLFLFREGKVGHLWMLPVIMALWVNIHGAFVLGVGLLGLLILEDLIEAARSGRRPSGHLLLVGLLTMAATAVNPIDPAMLLYPFGYYLGRTNPSFDVVTEFQSPNFHDPLQLLFGAGLVVLILLGMGRQRRAWGDGMLAAVFVLQSLVSARQVSVCAMVLVPVLARRLCEGFAWARERQPVRLPRPLALANWAVLAGAIVAAAVCVRRPAVQDNLQLGSTPKTGSMPQAGARYIQEHELPGPVFHEQAWGGYLIYAWYPERRVFIDGRIDMYGPEIVRRYSAVVTLKPQWREVLDEYGVQTILIAKGSPLAVLLEVDGHWRRVFRGEVEAIYVRRHRVTSRVE